MTQIVQDGDFLLAELMKIRSKLPQYQGHLRGQIKVIYVTG